MTPLHMGALHPVEQALTLLLAFGPFVVLGILVWRRRGDGAEPPPGREHPEEKRSEEERPVG